MRPIALDQHRLEALTIHTESELIELTEGVLHSTSEIVEAVTAGVEREDLPAVAQAAHRGRNEALLVGAGELDAGFAKLEAGARSGQLDAVRDAAESIRMLWPQTRAAIERIPANVSR